MSQITIPYQWISFCDDNPVGPHVRWDSYWLERILEGTEWRVPAGYQFVHREIQEDEGGILIAPVGHYAEHQETGMALFKLQNLVEKLRWCILIATSDEGSLFPWQRFNPSQKVQLWVQTPRPDHKYPRRTRFFGFGSPTPAKDFPKSDRDLDVMFSGQVNHSRREQMRDAVTTWARHHPKMVLMNGTSGFAEGFEGEHYNKLMSRTILAPAPSGPVTQDSFRCYEALEAGAVPIQDAYRPDGGGFGYWDMIDLNLAQIEDWAEFDATVDYLHQPDVRAQVQSEWQRHKREVVRDLHDDVMTYVPGGDPTGPDDLITVVVPTSPSPVHPSLEIIQPCIESVRQYLPDAEILITCDGIRNEQLHRRDAYHEYLFALADWTRTQSNVVPIIYQRHLHESGMLKRMIHEVNTPYILYMEGDTTLIGEIDFGSVLDEMWAYNLNVMRFSHEASVLEPHKHLFLETRAPEDRHFIRTVQFSTRPSVWSTMWTKEMLDTYVGQDARSMIEDMWVGPLQHRWVAPYADKKLLESVWSEHRTAVWAPLENIKHSGHLDGRGEDPKYPMYFDYPSEGLPKGASYRGWHDVS